MTTAVQELRRRLDAIVQSDHHPYDVQLAIEALGIVEQLSAQTAEDMPVAAWYRTERDITDEYFTNYSDGPDRPDGEGWKPLCDPQTVMAEQFRRAVEGPQSGISSLVGRPHEQNDAVQEGK